MSDTNNIKPATGYVSTSLHEAVKLRIGKQGLAAIKPRTIPQYFREYVQKYEQYPALSYQPEVTLTANDVVKTPTAANAPQQQQQHKVQSTWQTLNYKQYLEQVEQTALMFMHVGLQPRSSVGVLAMNCPAWFYSELGALFAGGVATGIYPSSSAASVFHVLDTSEATVCVVDNSEQMAKVRSVKSRLPRLRAVIQLHGPYDDFVGIEDGYYSWQALTATNYGEKLREELARRERNVGANECALLIYTSGTTGMPKGVMLSHDAVVYGTESLTEAISSHSEMTTQERIVTFLPLNHIAGQLMDIYLSFRNGACVYFADRNALKSSLVKTLRYARPTRFFSVPRVFEKMQEQFMAMSTKSAGLTRFVLDTARQIMLRHHLDKFEGKNPSNVKHWLVEKVVRQVKAAFGLAEARTIMIGGAPSSTDLAHFFLSIDLPLVDCFGLSETGAINFNYDMHNIGTVGKVLDGTEEKIFNPDENGHGEICIRGRTCLMGYLHEMEKTKESLREDGWFHTGDIGYMNTAGELMVTGRIKELIITAGGENIPPQNIENFIKSELNALSNCILVGDNRKYLTVLLTLKTEIDPNTGYPLDALQAEAVEWLRSLNLNYTRLSEVLNIPADIHELDAASIEVKPDPKVLEAVEEGIKRANKHAISNAQRVQKFRFLPHDLSVPTGELGNTLKIRRNIILKKYANVIEQMYK